MGRTTAWETYMRQAAAQLGRACAETAAHMAENETASVREIRELAGAMKELTALHAALGGNPAALRSTVQVAFDEERINAWTLEQSKKLWGTLNHRTY